MGRKEKQNARQRAGRARERETVKLAKQERTTEGSRLKDD